MACHPFLKLAHFFDLAVRTWRDPKNSDREWRYFILFQLFLFLNLLPSSRCQSGRLQESVNIVPLFRPLSSPPLFPTAHHSSRPRGEFFFCGPFEKFMFWVGFDTGAVQPCSSLPVRIVSLFSFPVTSRARQGHRSPSRTPRVAPPSWLRPRFFFLRWFGFIFPLQFGHVGTVSLLAVSCSLSPFLGLGCLL